MHELLSIEDGGFVDGKFKRTDKSAERSNRFENAGPNFAATERADAEAEQPEEDEIVESPSINLLKNIRLVSKEQK
jgi:hypothetical protein